MEELIRFREAFKALTGVLPFPWQEELYMKHFSQGTESLPSSCTLPTGLGKTAVVAIWLIALARHPGKLPRRLVYVVNRRTVVDQTTNEVEKLRDRLREKELREKLGGDWSLDDDPPLAISTLRGQFADNREWSADPSRPAVICGTVDMIGSRLLFSGYGVGFKAKPLHAGFLGQDALIVHDEAHLEPAFQALLDGIVPEPTDDEPPIHTVWRRLKARKRLHLKQAANDAEIAEEIADLALRLRKDKQGNDANAAIAIFVRMPDEVLKVCDRLTNKKDGVPQSSVRQLTGTMRGLERDALAKQDRVFMRFLPEKSRNPSVTPVAGTVFLVCTSAGEVGIDISADHMVCDLSTFESMIQRFGRVNRYGVDSSGKPQTSHIHVIYPPAFGKIDRKTDELRADEIESRRKRTLDLLRLLNESGKSDTGDPIYDANPKALGDLQKRQDLPCRIEDAYAPKPTIPTATDILFDAWALTSITQPMPGRPEVAPYVHGIAKELPQTTIAWRAELDLLKDDPSPTAALKAIFSKHRIRPHESLTFITVQALLDDPGPLNADPTLVLPESFGGLDEKGMLAIPKPDRKKSAAPEVEGGDMAAENEASAAETVSSLDIADKEGYERDPAAKARQRILINRSGEGWTAHALPGAAPQPRDWNLDGPEDKSTRLVTHLEKKSGLKVRLVQPIKLDEEGDPACSLVCLSPPPKQQTAIEQALENHVALVERQAERLANALLANERVVRAALRFAAKWHDEGKKSRRWQRYIGRRRESDPPLGKAAEWRDPKLLAGYRHEFGTLLRIADDEARRYFAEAALNLTPDEQRHAVELALHLIAAHHGYARPHFTHPWDDESTTTVCEQMHFEVIRRFGRLQRRYGRWGLAYLESLLRAADWAASSAAGNNPEVDDDDAADLERDEA